MELANSTNEATDDELVSVAHQGSEGAFAELFAHYRGRCVPRATVLPGNWDNADHDVKTAFCRVYRGLSGLQRAAKSRRHLTRKVLRKQMERFDQATCPGSAHQKEVR
jgi:hypothetical protein